MNTAADKAVRDPREVRDERQSALAEQLWDHAMGAIECNLPSAALARIAEEDVRAAVQSLVERLDEAGLTVIDRNRVAPEDPEDFSDGFHTVRELYEHRRVLTAALFNAWDRLDGEGIGPEAGVHKSKRHHAEDTDPMYDGMFKVNATLPTGQVSYHQPLEHWGLFQIPEREYAAEWDGHTSTEAADRIRRYLLGED